MSYATRTPVATLDDLYRFEVKAELIAGRIVPLMPTGRRPNAIAAEIFVGLRNQARMIGRGVAYADNVGSAVPELTSGRESFSPDASYYLGPLPADGMDFVPGPPTFAVEVRSKNDNAPAEEAMTSKRADYFEAGTLVVWDVDTITECVRSYRAETPNVPKVFARGEIAHANPALEDWAMVVDDIFD